MGLAIALSAPASLRAAERISYEKQVLPILQEHCFDCHGDGDDEGELKLDAWGSAKERDADLRVWKEVLGNVSAKVMPPPKRKVQPSEAERAIIENWIESEVFRYDPKKPDPGRVTIRRLNRAEYNNTVRDLLFVDFKPADDFPPDDTGYGFDTIGDVLSLSPALLEKYLRAAEQVVDAAIRTQSAERKKSYYGPGELRGDGRGGDVWVMSTNGEAATRHEFPQDGEYVFRVFAGAHHAGSEPAKMTMAVAGRDLHTFEIKNNADDPKPFERRVKMKKGRHAISAKFINDFYEPGAKDPKRRDRNLVLGGFEIEGPMDAGAGAGKLPRFHQKVLGGLKITPENRLGVTRRLLREFASRAYRRKVPEKEVDRLMRFVKLGFDEGGKYAFEKGIRLACQAVLVSPFFLFRGEVQKDPNNPDATVRIDEYALASRLSYFLWSSLPDDELFMQATRGTLRKNLVQQVRRMLADPKSKALAENFAGQWLQLRNLDLVQPDPATFAGFDDRLRASMRRETEMLFTHMVKGDLPITELLDAEYSFVDGRLAKHYGMAGVEGGGFKKVSLAGTRRRGVLTHGSILTITSNPTRTSPVKRGKWVLDNILGTPPPDPPPGVEPLDNNKELKGTLRQRLEQHRDDPNCAGCHALMDPLGLAFEHFDGVGKWRDRDGGEAIDPGGKLVSGEVFRSHEEFQQILGGQKRDDYLRCASEMMLTFALGRGLEFYDKPAVQSVVKSMKSNGLKFSSLVLGVVDSVPFQYRRGDGVRSYD